MIYLIIKIILPISEFMGLHDIFAFSTSALVMLAALIYQLAWRKWLKAVGTLVLGMFIVALAFLSLAMTGMYQSTKQPWTWHSTKAILPNGAGSITLLRRSSSPPSFFPVPGSEQHWKVKIVSGTHRPVFLKIGDMIDSSTNLRIYRINNGRNAIRLNIDERNIYYDLKQGRIVNGIEQGGDLLGTFYLGEFLPVYPECPKANGGLYHPCAVAVDRSGNVYVADGTNQMMVKYAKDGHFVTKWHLDKDKNYYDDLGSAYYSVAVDGAGSVWVLGWDGRIRKYASDGRSLKAFSKINYRLAPSDAPWGIAVGKDGSVYVTQRTGQMQKISSKGSVVFDTKKDNEVLRNEFNPAGICVTPNGDLLVANQSLGIERYNANGELTGRFGKVRHHWSSNDYPVDVKVDEAGFIYVAAWDRSVLFIEKHSSDRKLLLKWRSCICRKDDGPISIATGGGFVYIADEKNHRVLKFTDNGKPIPGWGK